ncbi:MAG: hypothetical protein LBR22_10880 [Desulfovibrio sp.]|jgi:hypothetical protein|nr:hypothetical protein [Desulfovibrio sp.]
MMRDTKTGIEFSRVLNTIYINLKNLDFLNKRCRIWAILKALTLTERSEAEKHAASYPIAKDIIQRQISLSSDKEFCERYLTVGIIECDSPIYMKKLTLEEQHALWDGRKSVLADVATLVHGSTDPNAKITYH